MEEFVRVQNLADILKSEYAHVNRIFTPLGTSIRDIFAFMSAHPENKIAAIALEVETTQLIAPETGRVQLKSRVLPLAEAKLALLETNRDAHASRNSFLTAERSEELTSVLLQSAEKNGAEIVEFATAADGRRRIGLLMVRPFELRGQVVSLVSWIWRASDADAQTAKSFRFDVYRILKERPEIQTVAMVHTANRASMSFFEKMGFNPAWVVRKY